METRGGGVFVQRQKLQSVGEAEKKYREEMPSSKKKKLLQKAIGEKSRLPKSQRKKLPV